MFYQQHILIFLSLFYFSTLHAAPLTQLTGVKFWKDDASHTRLIFNISRPVAHQLFSLPAPNRLVIDLKNTQLTRSLSSPNNHPIIKKIRSAPRNQTDLRIVLDLKTAVRSKSFLLKPAAPYGHRLVIDISNTPRRAPPQLSSTFSQTPSVKHYKKPTAPITPQKRRTRQTGRDLVIAIDAGHGGIDPGAIGKKGSQEKTVVLAIAKQLMTLMQREKGMHPVLIRRGDYFLPLRKRIELARHYHADLFLSIHADAFPDKNLQGSSVYMLSQKGASSEAAKWLAEKENAADLLGGVSLNDKNDLLASVLLDLSQDSTLEASAHVGKTVLSSLRSVGKVHHTRLQQAAFMVLRSPDIPSILIETAFISNPSEERKLNSPAYRKKIAQAILNGVRQYFSKYAPSGSLLAKNK